MEKMIAKMAPTNPRKFVPTDQHVTKPCFDAKDPDSAFPTIEFVTKCPTVLMAVTNLDARMITTKIFMDCVGPTNSHVMQVSSEADK